MPRFDGMRIRVCLVIVSVLAVAGCALFENDSDFPSSAILITPPPEFRVWWEVVESCSGRRERFDDVKWFQTNELSVRGENALGAWFSTGNRIALVGGADANSGPLVRHEMLHAVLRDGGHPSEYFESRCGDIVACGRDCTSISIPSEMAPLSLDDADVSIKAFPLVPSISRYQGRLSFILSIRNTSDGNGYLNSRNATAYCFAGIFLASVQDPDRFLLRCADQWFGGIPRLYLPGETRSVVIDVDLKNPDRGEGPFFAEPLNVGAVLSDNVRRIMSLTVRP